MTFNIFMIFILITLALSCLISLGNILLAEKEPQKEKITSYECGFNPIYYPDQPFSIRFFLVGILFLIFDLEIIFLMPWCYSTSTLSVSSQLWMIIFIILLILGLAYEWLKGGLEWC